jgi:hypothetical protein
LSVITSILFSVKAYSDLSGTGDASVSFEHNDDYLELVFPTYHLQQATERERAALNTPAIRYVAIPVCDSLICNQNVAILDLLTLPIVEAQEYLPLEENITEAGFPDFDSPIRCQYLNQRAGMCTQPCY